MTLPSFKYCCRLCLSSEEQKGGYGGMRARIESVFCILQIKMLRYNNLIIITEVSHWLRPPGPVSETGKELHPPHTPVILNVTIWTPWVDKGFLSKMLKSLKNDKDFQLSWSTLVCNQVFLPTKAWNGASLSEHGPNFLVQGGVRGAEHGRGFQRKNPRPQMSARPRKHKYLSLDPRSTEGGGSFFDSFRSPSWVYATFWLRARRRITHWALFRVSQTPFYDKKHRLWCHEDQSLGAKSAVPWLHELTRGTYRLLYNMVMIIPIVAGVLAGLKVISLPGTGNQQWFHLTV